MYQESAATAPAGIFLLGQSRVELVTCSRAGINHRVGKTFCCVTPREYILNLVFEGVGHNEELQSVIACVL